MADTRFCERCQKDVPRIGVHSCIKVSPATSVSAKAEKPTSSEAPVAPVTNVTNAVTNMDVERVRQWRAKRGDHYKAYMREYMRKRRSQLGNAAPQ